MEGMRGRERCPPRSHRHLLPHSSGEWWVRDPPSLAVGEGGKGRFQHAIEGPWKFLKAPHHSNTYVESMWLARGYPENFYGKMGIQSWMFHILVWPSNYYSALGLHVDVLNCCLGCGSLLHFCSPSSAALCAGPRLKNLLISELFNHDML